MFSILIYTTNEENLDVRYGKLKTDFDGKTKELTEANKLIAELKKSNKGNENMQERLNTLGYAEGKTILFSSDWIQYSHRIKPCNNALRSKVAAHQLQL